MPDASSNVRKLFVGPRVRRLREQPGWNQALLAERLRLSLSYVSQIETTQRPVTASVLPKLAGVFGGDVVQFSEELIEGSMDGLRAYDASRRRLHLPAPLSAQSGRILAQVAEMPDGTRFFGIARTIERGSGGCQAPRKRFAIGLGCELSQARELGYADGLSLDVPRNVALIGPVCRVCPREHCVQRAFPPAGRRLLADSNAESPVSYRF